MTDAARSLSAVFGFFLLLTSCTVTDVPPPTLLPAGPPAARIDEVSGEYCYYGPDYNVRTFRRGIGDLTFFDAGALEPPALVSVDASTDRIVFCFADRDGADRSQAFDVVEAGGQWTGGSLLIPRRAAPGFHIHGATGKGTSYFRHGSESRLFRLPDGRLVMSSSFIVKGVHTEKGEEKGSIHPTWFEKEDSVVVILDPAVGGCDADPSGRPFQPIFEPGLDIRVPACVSVLEEQVASILVEKGETPESAAAAAGERVRTLSSAAEALRFTVSTESGEVGRSYSFRVTASPVACTLELTRREKKTKKGFGYGVPSFASRKLPGCACAN